MEAATTELPSRHRLESAPCVQVKFWLSLISDEQYLRKVKLYLSSTLPFTVLPTHLIGSHTDIDSKATLDHGLNDHVTTQSASRADPRDRGLLAPRWRLGPQVLTPHLGLFTASCTASSKSDLDTMHSSCSAQLPRETDTQSNSFTMHFMQIDLSSKVLPVIEQPSLRTTLIRGRC